MFQARNDATAFKCSSSLLYLSQPDSHCIVSSRRAQLSGSIVDVVNSLKPRVQENFNAAIRQNDGRQDAGAGEIFGHG